MGKCFVGQIMQPQIARTGVMAPTNEPHQGGPHDRQCERRANGLRTLEAYRMRDPREGSAPARSTSRGQRHRQACRCRRPPAS